MLRTLLRAARALPAVMERLHLEWALREICPLHKDVPYIVNRIHELENT